MHTLISRCAYFFWRINFMITLITGGARSGKSSFAMEQFGKYTDVVYIATTRAQDKELNERILHHQQNRPKAWKTFEENYNLDQAVDIEKYYILDCLTMLSFNILCDYTIEDTILDFQLQKKIEDRIILEISSLIEKIKNRGHNLILITNEVGLGIVPNNPLSRTYQDILGRINQKTAEAADQVYTVICGIPLRLK